MKRKFNRFLSLALVLVLVISMLPVPALAAPEDAAPVLDSAWEVENQNENLVLNADGSVTITTEQGTIGGTAMKNVLYQKLPNSTDYDFTVKVSGEFTANYHGAYLMITSGKGLENAVGVVRRYHSYLGGRYGTNMLMGVMQDGNPAEYYEGAADIGNEFYLKLQKQNGRITGFYAAEYSDNDEDWNQIIDGDYQYVDKGNALIAPEEIYIAIGACAGGTDSATDITFSDLRIGGYPVAFAVDPANLDTVTLSGDERIEVGETTELVVTAYDYNGDPIADVDSVIFSSSDESVATVDENGVVTGVSNGMATITADVTVGEATRSASMTLQVGEIGVEESWTVTSPDGRNTITVERVTGGTLQYHTAHNGVENIGTSPLGLVTSLGDFSRNLVLVEASEVTEINESYAMLSGKADTYTDHCNEQVLTFARKDNDAVEFDVVVRAYDDGTAFKYNIRGEDGAELRISDETSGVQLPAEATVYWMNYASATWNYESRYAQTTTEGLAVGSTPSIPMLYHSDGVWTLFTEANLKGSYCGSMARVQDGGMLDIAFAPLQERSGDVVTTLPFTSPWRVAITGTPEDIVENTLSENLSDPADYETYHFDEWVKPGLSSWSWVTNWGGGISDQSKASTHLNWIEFGSEIGWDYYILDEGWNLGGRGNVRPGAEGMREWWPEVKAAAEEHGVGLWAWVHVSDIDTQAERDEHLAYWASEGIVGIKPDFFDGESQSIIQLYDALYADCAKYGLMVLVHGANKPTGEIRTWPNVYGREAIAGQEQGGITSEQYTLIPFIRAAIGPAEVTEELRSKDYNKTTMGWQVALTVLVEDGIHSMGSAPDVYRSVPEAMTYYTNFPGGWNETEFVGGEVGEYVSIARRAGTDWYVSGITVDPRSLDVPMTFLDEGKTYTALVIRENDRRDIDLEILPQVTSESTIPVSMLYGGGYAIRLIPGDAINAITEIHAPARLTVQTMTTVTAQITVGPETAEFKDVVWSSADETIATVDGNGAIRGISAGETIVTVASAFNPEVKAEIRVTVLPPAYVLSDVWQVLNPVVQDYVITSADTVTITAQNGVLGDGNADNLFVMDVPADDVDFTVTAKISGGLTANYQGGFLTVLDKADPDGTFVAAGRRHHTYLSGSHPAILTVMSNGGYEPFVLDEHAGEDLYIRIVKTGDVFTSSYSIDGENWTPFADQLTHARLAAAEDLAVGFYAGCGGGETPIDVTISAFTYNGEAIPVGISTADGSVPTGENDVPWDEMPAYSAVEPGQTYFTGNEWTGKTVDGVNSKEVFQVNREETRSSELIPYDSVDKAIEGAVDFRPELSDYYKLITGENESWQLAVYKNWDEATAAAGDFYRVDYDMDAAPKYEGDNTIGVWPNVYYGGFKEVTLPASWQTQGFDFPIYTNTQFPWPGQYGNAAEDTNTLYAPFVTNPVGLYRYWLDVDDSWLSSDRKVFISFQGVESAYYLYVNGNEVGYTEDSFDAHDFDITPFLNKDGSENLIAVKVLRWSDGSWFENQDYLRAAGIFRDVYVYSTPSVYLEDYKVETDLDEQFVDADLKLDIDLKNMSTSTTDGNFAVDVKLFDAEGNNVFANDPLTGIFAPSATGTKATVNLSRHVEAPHLWSDEDPYLYTLVLTLYDLETGAYYESTSQQLGFREISFTRTTYDANYNNTTDYYQTVTLNGNRFLFRGVNRHDNNPLTGRYVTKELYEEDITIMKQHNINAVRTSHYPDDRYFYYMCDKYGILVMGECNVEDHRTGNGESENYSPPYEEVIRDRIRTHMNAEKNRTCIVMWSYGNEAGTTLQSHVIQRAVELMNEIDSTRPKHYEGLCGQNNNSLLDVFSRMYADHNYTRNFGNNAQHMPYVLCEYAHAMGNSVGHLQEYWDAIRSADNLLGGFIWDYVDQSVVTEIPGAAPYEVYFLEADRSSNAFVGTMNGKLVEDETFGQVLDGYTMLTDTLNEGINRKLNDAMSGTKSFTVDLWIKAPASAASADMPTIFGKGDNQVALRQQGNQLCMYVRNDGGWVNLYAGLPADWAGNWHYVAAEVDNGTMKLFIDGVQTTDTNTAGNLAASNNPFGIGVLDGYPGRNGVFEFAKVRVYNKALTAAEQTAQMAADQGAGTYAIAADSANVVMWMDFSQAQVLSETVTDDVYDYYAELYEKQQATGIEDDSYINAEILQGKYLAYGGQWGETRNDDNFFQNGIISADRTVQDEIYEVKYQYQKFWFTADVDDILAHRFYIENESSVTDLSAYEVRYELTEDGKVIDSGVIADAACAANYGTAAMTVPYRMPEKPAADAEYFLKLSVCLKEDTIWADAGHEIAWEQFRVPAEVESIPMPEIEGTVTVEDVDDVLKITGEGFSLEIPKDTGIIENYVYGESLVMEQGPLPNFWRGEFDNDKSSGKDDAKWKNANIDMTVDSLTVKEAEDGTNVVVSVTLNMPNANNSKETLVYTIYATGEIKVDAKLQPGNGMGGMMKYGAEITLPERYENITWYGLGFWETLSDRKAGGVVGLYETTVFDSFFPYPEPQQSGNRVDVRYIAVEDPDSPVGILVVAKDLMEASALHFRALDYSGKKAVYQMPDTDYTILNVDYGSAGTGGATCGPDTLNQYRLNNDGRDYSYSYTIVPYLTASDDISELSKLWRDAESFDLDEHNREAAEAVEDLIDAIGVLLTYDQKADIEAARAAYEKLTDEQKALVGNYDALLAAEAAIESLVGAKAYILDKSVYANDAEITGTANILKNEDAPSGYAFTGGFSVPNDNGRVNAALSGSSKFTIEFWVNPSDLNTDNGFFMKGDTQVSIKTTNTGLEAFCYVNGWHPIVDVPFAQAGFEANQWNHVAMSYDGNTLKLYVDGVLVGSDTVAGTVGSNNYELGIGLNNDPGKANTKLRGQMDGVHVYNTILTEAEVAALADRTSAAAPSDENVVMWYDADGYKSVVEITGVTLDKTEAELLVGEELVLTATVAPENATDKALTWTSDNEAVAAVDNGKITALSAGQATITATAANGMGASCTVTVIAPHVHTPGEAVKENEKAASCTEDGSYDSVVYCTGCGEELSRETVTVLAAGHTEEIIPAVAPTCTETGLTEGVKCSVCDEVLTAQEEIPALGHDWKGTGCTRCDEKRENPFVDVPEDSFYIDPVLWAVEKGITNGSDATHFNPTGSCLRAQVVTFLWRAMGQPEPTTTENPFTDVSESDWYYKAVLWAVEEGITNGVAADRFGPMLECNRAQVVTFLWRTMDKPEPTSSKNPFSDVNVDDFYGKAVLWAVENSITNGMGDGTFGINGICNRAQVVTFLYRTLVK